jgi:hypothetical protein
MNIVYKLVVNHDGMLKSLNFVHNHKAPGIFIYTPGIMHVPEIGLFFVYTDPQQSMREFLSYGKRHGQREFQLWTCETTAIRLRKRVLDPYSMKQQDFDEYWREDKYTVQKTFLDHYTLTPDIKLVERMG